MLNNEAHLMELKGAKWPRKTQNPKKHDKDGKATNLFPARN